MKTVETHWDTSQKSKLKTFSGMELKKVLCSTATLAYELFTKDPRTVIRAQVGGKSTEEMQHEMFAWDVYCHLVNTQFDRKAVPILKEINKPSLDVNISWEHKRNDGVQSSVGHLQQFTYKTQTFSEAGAFSFYPILATLLNVSRAQRHNHTNAGQKIRAYFPVEHHRKDEQTLETSRVNKIENGHSAVLSRFEIL